MDGLASPAGGLMPECHGWRHEEPARDERTARDHRYRRREMVRPAIGDAVLVGAVGAPSLPIGRAFA